MAGYATALLLPSSYPFPYFPHNGALNPVMYLGRAVSRRTNRRHQTITRFAHHSLRCDKICIHITSPQRGDAEAIVLSRKRIARTFTRAISVMCCEKYCRSIAVLFDGVCVCVCVCVCRSACVSMFASTKLYEKLSCRKQTVRLRGSLLAKI